jgi:outer membrane protein assembly factor BamB
LAALILLVAFVVPLFVPDAMGIAVIGPAAGSVAVIVWWVFFSRAPWPERLGALAAMIAAIVATRPVLHESIATAGMGMLFYFYAIPAMSVALVAWAAMSGRLSDRRRRLSMLAAILLASGVFTLLRSGGITGEGDSDLHWRWTRTPEERLLAQAADERGAASRRSAGGDSAPGEPTARPANPTAAEIPDAARAPGTRDEAPARAPAPAPTRVSAATPDESVATESGDRPIEPAADPTASTIHAEWPGFRGPKRDGVVRGVRIETDWSGRPPTELWRRPIGPGWSSFAVAGDRVYTQEQRGDEELVSAYRLTTGEPVWRHRDAVRFWESNGGPGPRATPAVHDGRVYTMGATGIVNALDARNGSLVWTRNAATDTGRKVPDWGFAGSPLVIDDLVIVAVAGQPVAYEAATGKPRWLGPEGGGGYSSPHLATIQGAAQILLMRGSRTISVVPADGSLLWDHTGEPGVAIVQPGLTEEGDVLLASGDAMGGNGIRRVAVARGSDGWKVQERWMSRGLKPYFNDFVVHEGHAFGFDGSILACIDLADGNRKWKGGRFGHGQLLLLPDQDVLLVLSEGGELALVGATTDAFKELARFPALEGKTWNHPVLIGDILLVRNGEQMAAFRLSLGGR